MPAFPKPKFVFNFELNEELNNLSLHKIKRKIPEKNNTNLLLASWNIANLGAQNRWRAHYSLLAHIVEWFDIIAVQEVNNKLEGIRLLESERIKGLKGSLYVFSKYYMKLSSEELDNLKLVGEYENG